MGNGDVMKRARMQGVVKFERGDGFVELRDVDASPPGLREVKVEVRAAGVCGSDLHVLRDDIKIAIVPPVVMGHEFSGVIVEKGAEVGDALQIGDRVTGESNVSTCGVCRYCRTGFYNLCSHRTVLGYSAHGCYAKFCNVAMAHKLPDNVSFEAGALTEPLACCVHGALEQTGIQAGDSVLVIGPGPAGILAALVAVSAGGKVTLCGTTRDQQRLQLARELGVPETLDVETCLAVDIIRERTGGDGADVVLECSGAAAGARLGLAAVRKRGKYAQFGLFGRAIELDFEQIAFKELQVTGSISQHRPSWEKALTLISQGAVPTDRLISHELPLSAWRQAFDLMEARQCLKIILRP